MQRYHTSCTSAINNSAIGGSSARDTSRADLSSLPANFSLNQRLEIVDIKVQWERRDSRHGNKSLLDRGFRTASAADILTDEIEDSACEILGDAAVKTSGTMKKLQLQRICGIESDSRLDWPERSLDTALQVLSSSFKLQRVFSSNARVGCDWMDNPLISSAGLKRAHHSSGNLASMSIDQEDIPNNIDSL